VAASVVVDAWVDSPGMPAVADMVAAADVNEK
jgi:hypothetical protein